MALRDLEEDDYFIKNGGREILGDDVIDNASLHFTVPFHLQSAFTYSISFDLHKILRPICPPYSVDYNISLFHSVGRLLFISLLL